MPAAAKKTAGGYAVDLNLDFGEDYGVWRLGPGEEILDQVTSANLACGFHAGDPQVMRRAIEACARRGVAVGAHPGYPDRRGFGRRPWPAPAAEVVDDVLYQAGALAALARTAGVKLGHLKLHGALYWRAAQDAELARALVRSLAAWGGAAAVYTPEGSALAAAAAAAGLRVVREAFADRRYRPDGGLVPQGEPGAFLDPAAAARQAVQIAREGRLRAQGGAELKLAADSIGLHADAPGALETAARVRRALAAAGVALASPA
ncbi:MAG: LamB/YcsF family protein [Thermaerobacter sp.]|nr:LamB/YcsF family protein [Thermaerobacter sp.]